MKQKHRDAIIRSTKSKTENELALRADKCAKHLLLGVSFREMSEVTLDLTDCTLLSPIGFYYSMFHTSVALLNINCMIEAKSLEKVKHKYLIKTLKTEYVQKGILDKYFLNLVKELKSYREKTNYSMTEYSFIDSKTKEVDLLFDLFDRSKIFYIETGRVLEIAIQLIKEISSFVDKKFDFDNSIKLYIGDSKGDDLLQTYFSEEMQTKIWKYLLEKDLTT